MMQNVFLTPNHSWDHLRPLLYSTIGGLLKYSATPCALDIEVSVKHWKLPKARETTTWNTPRTVTLFEHCKSLVDKQ